MAQQDITGLLTGMFSGDPAALNQKLLAQKAVASNPNLLATTQTQIGNAPEQLARMRQSVGGMFGQDLRSTSDKVREQLTNLDTTTAAGQQEAVSLLKRIDPAKGLALQREFEIATKEANDTDGIIGKINPQFYKASSIAAFEKTLRETGVKDYKLLQEIDQAGEAYKIGVMTDIRASNKKRSEAFSSAAGLAGKLDVMSEILDSGELVTGSLANLSKSGKGFVQYLFPDADIAGLAEAEVFEGLSNQLALLIRNPESGMGLPGATSNADLAFLKASVPGLQKSPEGNKMLIDVYRKTYAFQKRMVQEQARLIKENGGIPPLDMEARMVDYVNNQDILGEELRNKIKESDAPSFDKTRLAADIAEARAARLAARTSAQDTGKNPKRTLR